MEYLNIMNSSPYNRVTQTSSSSSSSSTTGSNLNPSNNSFTSGWSKNFQSSSSSNGQFDQGSNKKHGDQEISGEIILSSGELDLRNLSKVLGDIYGALGGIFSVGIPI
ncbi:hypothetical protein TIFTF001_018662 [Ficus carica]|uniref:Uncharacterized protein n=1 Tax=Ficus carica TaxID=3494 RepID=A0AA88D9G5_FICCA|nr:hypothetical protein TIFTF001_018662 [Ficus carica]